MRLLGSEDQCVRVSERKEARIILSALVKLENAYDLFRNSLTCTILKMQLRR